MSFSNKATARLNMQAPELGKFVVAFKDLTDELPEDTGIQIGMFICNLSGKYIYIPVMSKADTVQPIESMFDSAKKEFIPLTKKSVRWMVDTGYKLGDTAAIPNTVAKDPDLYDAIVPPKTGKFVYASEGRLGGFISALPGIDRKEMKDVIFNDIDIQNAIAPLMDIEVIRELLEADGQDTEEVEEVTKESAPAVITNGDDLTDIQVQDILSKGYTVVNPPSSTRVVVESGGTENLTRLSNIAPGHAVMAMNSEGRWVGVAGLRMAAQITNDEQKRGTKYHLLEGGRSKVSGLPRTVAITEDGNILTDPNIVTNSVEVSYDDIMKGLEYRRLTDVERHNYGMIFTGAEWIGPIDVHRVEKVNGWTYIVGKGIYIATHPSINAIKEVVGNKYILSDAATFYPCGYMDKFETDLSMAEMKNCVAMEKLLPGQATLMHRDGVYALDGKEIGGKPRVVEHLLHSWETDVPTVEFMMNAAEEKGQVLVKMAAKNGGGLRPTGHNGNKRQDMYQHGALLPRETQISGSAQQRAAGMGKSIKNLQVKDREAMEATIISEMLQNPDMKESIQEYLPEISEAVDRLGRTLFLMRINTHKLSDEIDSESLNTLLTSTRNAYKLLGENYVALQNLVSGE